MFGHTEHALCLHLGRRGRARGGSGQGPVQHRRHDPGLCDRTSRGRSRACAAGPRHGTAHGDALRRIAIASQSSGLAAALVHAKDDAARRFYLRCAEFIEYPEDNRTLFLLTETVVAAFSWIGIAMLRASRC